MLTAPLGYNFLSLSAIRPYLERTASGPSTQWAKATAKRLNCNVTVGYPEISASSSNATINDFSSSRLQSSLNDTKACLTININTYNSTVTVSPSGQILAHYRKTHLYYTDETWAEESPTGWLTTSIPLSTRLPNAHSKISEQPVSGPTPIQGAEKQTSAPNPSHSIKTAFGICMDLNSKNFHADHSVFEFVSHILSSSAGIVIVSMAWLTHLSVESLTSSQMDPDLGTLGYWLMRLKPLTEAAKETTVVLANRCGIEEGDARYAGTSCVLALGNGKVRLWGALGRGEEGLLKVDTSTYPKWTVRGQEEGEEKIEEEAELER